MGSVKRDLKCIYMMFLRLILSFGETGALCDSMGSAGRAYGDGNCRAIGLAAALDSVGRGSTGSASEWKGGSARCATLTGAECGREW
jgi:hypothetical protein